MVGGRAPPARPGRGQPSIPRDQAAPPGNPDPPPARRVTVTRRTAGAVRAAGWGLAAGLDVSQRNRGAAEHDAAVAGWLAVPQVQRRVPDLRVSPRLRPLARPRLVRRLADVVLQLIERLSGDARDSFPGGLA